MISFREFARLLDGAGYHKARLWKIDAYEIYRNGGQKIFYPDKIGHFKYLVDGSRQVIAQSVHDGTTEFVTHQEFDLSKE